MVRAAGCLWLAGMLFSIRRGVQRTVQASGAILVKDIHVGTGLVVGCNRGVKA